MENMKLSRTIDILEEALARLDDVDGRHPDTLKVMDKIEILITELLEDYINEAK